MCENSFSGGGSKWCGFLVTSRANSNYGWGSCALSASRTTVTCPGLTDSAMRNGEAIRLATGATTYQSPYQWRDVVTADNVAKVYPVDLFSYKVPTFWATRSCQLEVSLEKNLITDEGAYTVVDSIRPDYYKRGDSDKYNRHATRSADGLTRIFQVGASVQELDDTGVTRSIALNAASTYYYRLMCGGAVERGQF